MADVEQPDDLYVLEPSEFVAARTALAKRLRSEGRRDEAEAIAKLRRPNATAFALNRAAREEPAVVEAALEAGARLREATEAALAGDPSRLRAATTEERAATEAAVDAAARHLGARGAAVRQQIAATLRAAVLDEVVADELRRGLLTTDYDASGFGFAADVAGAAAPARTRRKPASARKGGDADAGARRAAEAQAREQRARRKELEAQVRTLERRVAKLQQAADDAEATAHARRVEADAAVLELEAAQQELADLDR